MARPSAGRPPVRRSAAAPPQQASERRDLIVYSNIVEAFTREDRMADLRAMFGGSEDLVQRFLSVALNSIATNSDLLMNCTPASIIQAVKDSATLGLEPTGLTGEAAIVRYKDVARLRPMYRGYLKRIRNSGKVQDIDAQVVYEGDTFRYWYDRGGFNFEHRPVMVPANVDPENDPRGSYAYFYAYAVMPTGFVEGDVMTAAEVWQIRDRNSEAWNGQNREASPWFTQPGEMGRKTVIRRLSKRLPQEATSVETREGRVSLLSLDELADNAASANSPNAFDATAARRRALASLTARSSQPALADGLAEEPASGPQQPAAQPEQPEPTPAGPQEPEGLMDAPLGF